jgi:GNAT superfamily N-acetyltransferase
MVVGKKIVAALHWMDVRLGEQRFAYIYAVAVAEARRGKGLARKLMEDAQSHLAFRGYDGVLLVPQTEELRAMYRKLGYADCTTVSEFPAQAGESPAALQRIDREEYAKLRKEMLPAGSAVEDEENIAFLETMAFFYRGENLLLAAHAENGKLWCPEFLGDAAAAPGILKALNCTEGHFRTPGNQFPFAMFLPLTSEATPPKHLALAFD